MNVSLNLPHELRIRKLGQHILLGTWLYEAIYILIKQNNVGASFSVEQLYPIAIEQLRIANMISQEMVEPMIAQRTTLSALKRMDMQLAALRTTGHIERIAEGLYQLTTYGIQEILEHTTRTSRLAYAAEIRRQYDRQHK